MMTTTFISGGNNLFDEGDLYESNKLHNVTRHFVCQLFYNLCLWLITFTILSVQKQYFLGALLLIMFIKCNSDGGWWWKGEV